MPRRLNQFARCAADLPKIRTRTACARREQFSLCRARVFIANHDRARSTSRRSSRIANGRSTISTFVRTTRHEYVPSRTGSATLRSSELELRSRPGRDFRGIKNARVRIVSRRPRVLFIYLASLAAGRRIMINRGRWERNRRRSPGRYVIRKATIRIYLGDSGEFLSYLYPSTEMHGA